MSIFKCPLKCQAFFSEHSELKSHIIENCSKRVYLNEDYDFCENDYTIILTQSEKKTHCTQCKYKFYMSPYTKINTNLSEINHHLLYEIKVKFI